MTDYFFSLERSPNRDCFAETDHVGGACQIYLGEFMSGFHDELYAYGDALDDMIIGVLKAVLIHEDLHVEICKVVDTNGGQEHDSVYEWIRDWLNKTKDRLHES